MSWAGLILFHVAALMSPGPDFALILKISLREQFRPILYSAVGIGLGLCFHLAFLFFGLALFEGVFENLVFYLKIFASIYFFYLGIGGFWEIIRKSRSNRGFTIVNSDRLANEESEVSPFRAFRQGFSVNVVNPKALIYFVAFLGPQVIGLLSIGEQVLLAILIVLTSIIYFVVLGSVILRLKARVLHPRFWFGVEIFVATLFIVFSLVILLD